MILPPRNTTQPPGRSASWLIVCVLFAGVVLSMLGVMAYLYRATNRMATRQAPLVDAAIEIRLEATLAHLVLEEILSGDRTEDVGSAWAHFDRADRYAKMMLEGGSDEAGTLLPVTDPVLRREIQGIREHLAHLRSAAERRHDHRDSFGPGSEADQMFDRLFAAFLDRAEAVEHSLQESLLQELSGFRRTQISLIVATFILGLLLGGVLYRVERRKHEARQKLQLALGRAEHSEERFRDLTHSMADWVWELDATGAFTFCSERVTDFLGVGPGELAGRPLLELVAPEDLRRMEALFARAATDRHPVRDVENWKLRKPEGRLCSLTSFLPLHDAAGTLQGFRGVDRDVTAKRRAQEALVRTELDLRQKVEELAKANQLLVEEVRERQRAEDELRDSRDSLRRVSAALWEAEEVQRARIAHDLREQVAQSCYAVRFALEDALGRGARGAKGGNLEHVFRALDDTAEQMRGISMELRPSMLDDLGVLASLSWACRNCERSHEDLRVECSFALEEQDIPPALKTPLFRTLEEALAVTAGHGHTRFLRLEISCSEGEIQLSLERLEPTASVSEAEGEALPGKGPNLDSVRHRVELSGGSLALEGPVSAWVRLTARWPRGEGYPA